MVLISEQWVTLLLSSVRATARFLLMHNSITYENSRIKAVLPLFTCNSISICNSTVRVQEVGNWGHCSKAIITSKKLLLNSHPIFDKGMQLCHYRNKTNQSTRNTQDIYTSNSMGNHYISLLRITMKLHHKKLGCSQSRTKTRLFINTAAVRKLQKTSHSKFWNFTANLSVALAP